MATIQTTATTSAAITAFGAVSTEEHIIETVCAAIDTGRSPLRAVRKYRGLSKAGLARLAGISIDEVQAIEAGETPTLPQAQALAAALDVPVQLIH